MSEELPDGRRMTRDINYNDALGNLQTMQGQIAYQILYQRDKALPFSQNQLIEAANKVPARAFEAYIKGLLTDCIEVRENYFKNAMRLFTARRQPGALFRRRARAWPSLSRASESVPRRSMRSNGSSAQTQQCHEKARDREETRAMQRRGFAEASFYIGLIFLQQGNFESAMATLRPLAEDLKLTTVYNALGCDRRPGVACRKKEPGKGRGLAQRGHRLSEKGGRIRTGRRECPVQLRASHCSSRAN